VSSNRLGLIRPRFRGCATRVRRNHPSEGADGKAPGRLIPAQHEPAMNAGGPGEVHHERAQLVDMVQTREDSRGS
jgi:hypothetical protein